MCYKQNNDIFGISVKNTFRGTYCSHRLNFTVDQCSGDPLHFPETNFEPLATRNRDCIKKT